MCRRITKKKIGIEYCDHSFILRNANNEIQQKTGQENLIKCVILNLHNCLFLSFLANCVRYSKFKQISFIGHACAKIEIVTCFVPITI